LHDRIISLRGEIWTHKTILTPSLYIEVSVPNLKREQSCICVYGVPFLPLSVRFWNCFLCFILIIEINVRETRRANQEWTIKNEQSRMDNQEWTIKNGQSRMGNQEWTIKRHWQHWEHKTQDEGM
jgi:hypothetical protein